ncbi:MAG TPA: lysylphosphatidylglycerol synthase domain-containing protein [Cellvibrionaceae bacterium]
MQQTVEGNGFFSRAMHWCKVNIPWQWVKKILTWCFFILIAWLLIQQAMTIEWQQVFETIKQTSKISLLTGFLLAVCCYIAFGSYDLLGRYLTGIKASVAKVWFIAWLSYAFNLNLGAAVGGVAFRYRLYSKVGVSTGDTTRIIGFSVLTNWLGYIALAGVLFVSGQIEPPASWQVGKLGIQILGAVFIGVIFAYLAACGFSRKRQFSIRDFTLTLPKIHFAFLQLAMASLHWLLMASVIYQFMPEDIAFATVFAVLLVSAIAGAVTHIPGGLGVIEAVFVALLAGQADKPAIIAALFAYRCVFYLAPLGLATAAYFIFEAFVRDKQ